jgi:putative transposase
MPVDADSGHEAQSQVELEALRRSVRRGCPSGSEDWQRLTVQRLGLDATLCPLGRPRKQAAAVAEKEG